MQNQRNILKTTMYSVNGSAFLNPSHTIIKDVRFDALESFPEKNIEMHITGAGSSPNYMQEDIVEVENYDQVAGDDFRLYYLEQAPDYVVPETDSNGTSLIGAPIGDTGLTNQELVDLYPNGTTIKGVFYDPVAVGGAISPTSNTRTGLRGFVENY